jgi:hypothetical protein
MLLHLEPRQKLPVPIEDAWGFLPFGTGTGA